MSHACSNLCKAALDMDCAQVGEMTDAPIKTRFGYHIILVEGRK